MDSAFAELSPGLERIREKKSDAFTREEYHLTAGEGGLHSRSVQLNGKRLTVDSLGRIPDLEGAMVSASEPIIVGPFCIVFVHIPYFDAPACRV